MNEEHITRRSIYLFSFRKMQRSIVQFSYMSSFPTYSLLEDLWNSWHGLESCWLTPSSNERCKQLIVYLWEEIEMPWWETAYANNLWTVLTSELVQNATENSGFFSSGFTVLSVREVGGHPTARVGLLCRKVWNEGVDVSLVILCCHNPAVQCFSI